MSILNYEEHITCSNYLSEVRLGFKYIEVEKGTIFSVDDKKEKHLFFFMEGDALVRYNEFPNKRFGKGEMIFLPKSADCYGEALTACKFLLLIYDAPVRLCDKVRLESIIRHSQNIQYEFKSLPVRPVLESFLTLLRTYLQTGINCLHLHEIKQKELFILLHGFYSKEELAQFFFPMLGKSLDFRSSVMANYPLARTAKDLAAMSGYSEDHFIELFEKEFSDTPYQWMQKQKAKHIMGRLSQDNVSIKDIVNEFNFTCPSHFSKYCKRHFGTTPSELKARLSTGNK